MMGIWDLRAPHNHRVALHLRTSGTAYSVGYGGVFHTLPKHSSTKVCLLVMPSTLT